MEANWDWADALIQASEYADIVEDCEFDEETGDHVYFTETGEAVRVDPEGHIVLCPE